MQAGERFGQARHADLAALSGGEVLLFLHLPQERGQIALQQLAQHPLRYGLGRRIDHEDGAAGSALLSLGGAAGTPGLKNGELAGLDLAAVKEAHGPGGEQEVPLADPAIEPRLSRPGAGDVAGLVLDHGLKDAQTLARGDDPGAAHPPDDDGSVPHLEPGHRLNGGGVLIAPGHVIEQVARLAYAQSCQILRAPGTDALEVLDGRVEP